MLEYFPDFMTLAQVAEALQIGRSTSYALTSEWTATRGASGLPFVWFGRQKRVPKMALIRFAEQAMPHTPNPWPLPGQSFVA